MFIIQTCRTSVHICFIERWKMVDEMKENRTHHYRIVKPFRFFLFVVISIMIIVFAGYTVVGAGNAEAASVRQYVQVTIGEGDNLWSIVERCNKDSRIDVQQTSSREINYSYRSIK